MERIHAPKHSSTRSRVMRWAPMALLLALAMTTLSGCIVAPIGWGYDHDHHHDGHSYEHHWHD